MRRVHLAWVLLLLPVACRSVSPPQQIKKADGIITEASIRGHMEFLASDALNGRRSGTRDEWLAATYIASQFRRWQIEPLGDNGDFVQVVSIGSSGTLKSPPVLSASTLQFRYGEDILVQAMAAGESSGLLVKLKAGEIAPAKSVALLPEGTAPDSPAASAASIVLSPETTLIRSGWEQAAARLPTIPVRLMVHGGIVPVPQTRIVLSQKAYMEIVALADGSPVKFEADVKYADAGVTYNAVGKLTGSNPMRSGEAVLLTAHLDHVGVCSNGADKICNGADDDASGTIAVMELAEAIAKGTRPERSILFALFGSEEDGGKGAAAFVGLPPVPLDHIIANLEFEMIGRPDNIVPPHTLWLTGYERSNLGRELAKQGAHIVADPHPEQGFFMRSDNFQLARAGVVAHTVSSFGLHSDYHQPSDEIRTIDFAHMTESIQSMLGPVLSLANSGFKPEWLPGQKPN